MQAFQKFKQQMPTTAPLVFEALLAARILKAVESRRQFELESPPLAPVISK